MNIASGIVLIIAGLTAGNPSAQGGHDRYGQYGQLENNGNDFNFVPDEYGAALPQNFGFNRLHKGFGNNPLHAGFGNNPPQFQREISRFTQPIIRNLQDTGKKFRQVTDNLNNRIRQAVPLIASHIVPLPVGRLVNLRSEENQSSPRGDRNSVSFPSSGVSGSNPDFLKPVTSAFSAASASSGIAQAVSGFSGSQNPDSNAPHVSGFSASFSGHGIPHPISGLSGSQNSDSHGSSHFVPSSSDIVTQATSGFFGPRPEFLRPPIPGFFPPSASNIIAQATTGFSGSQDSNSHKPFTAVHQGTSGLLAPFNHNAASNSGSHQASNSFQSSGSGSSSPTTLSNTSQRTERSSPLVSKSKNDQFTTSQPVTQVTPNAVVETTTTPPPPPPNPTSTIATTTTTTTAPITTAGSVKPAGGEVIASASSATASASSASTTMSENKGSETITKVSTATSTSSSSSSTSVEAPASTATTSKRK